MTALGRQLLTRASDDRPALFSEDRTWSYRELVEEGWRRASLFAELRDPDRPPHIGVLLDNVPDYLLWLVAGGDRPARSSSASTRPTAATSWPS